MKNAMYKFVEIPFHDYDVLFDSSPILNTTPFVTPEWLTFVESAKDVSMHVVKIQDQSESILGFLFFGVFRIGPFRLASSPYFGWDSETMGPALSVAAPQPALLKEASKYIHSAYKASLIQFSVVENSPCFVSDGEIKREIFTSPVIDISKQEDILLATFRNDVRTNIRFFAKKGGTFKALTLSDDIFAAFYDMTLDVYRRRGMAPLYTKHFFEKMFDAFIIAHSKDRCLVLGAFNSEGACIAISVALIFGEEATLQCLSDYKSGLVLHPIEPLIWRNIQELKKMGVKRFNLLGESAYKNKFAPAHREVARYYFGNKLLLLMQSKAKSFLEKRNQKKEKKAKSAKKQGSKV